MLGKHIDYKDLQSFDSELYHNLSSLRGMGSEIRDLGLTFAVSAGVGYVFEGRSLNV